MPVKDEKAAADLAAGYRQCAAKAREVLAMAEKLGLGIDLPTTKDGAIQFDKWAEDLENGSTYVTTEHGS